MSTKDWLVLLMFFVFVSFFGFLINYAVWSAIA